MNVNDTIYEALREQNGAYHENTSYTECKVGEPVKNARWVKRSELSGISEAGFPIYFDEENVLLAPFAQTLITGSTGTGKTETLYKNIPLIFSEFPDELKPSILVMDLKGDMHPRLIPKLRESGYETLLFDMRNPYRSAPYNLFYTVYCDYQRMLFFNKAIEENKFTSRFDGKQFKSARHAKNYAYECSSNLMADIERTVSEISFIIVPNTISQKDPIWANGARTMCRAIIWTMLRDSEKPENGMDANHFTLLNLCRIAFSTGDDCDEIVDWLSAAEDIPCVKAAITSNYKLRAKVTRDGYVSTLNTQLGEYTNHAIAAITANEGSIDLREIAKSEKPYAIFVITDDRQEMTNSICMLFINNLINELVAFADNSPTHSLPRDYVILADEFANMPPMPDLKRRVTTLRSRKIWLTMAIQSKPQLDNIYGSDIARVVRDNCDYNLFLGCNDDETKTDFAKSMGMTIGVKTAFNISNNGEISATKVSENVPIIRNSDLDELTLGEILIRSRKTGNLKTYMKPNFLQADKPVAEEYEESFFRTFDANANVYDIEKTVELRPEPVKRKFNFDF